MSNNDYEHGTFFDGSKIKQFKTANLEISEVPQDMSPSKTFVLKVHDQMDDDSELKNMIAWLKREFKIIRKD